MKSGFVGLIGMPNVGKSTLVNKIIGQKIAITSSKPQTTRNSIMGIYTTSSSQIIFIDTPGIHKSANYLDEYMANSTNKIMMEADILTVIVDEKTKLFDGSFTDKIISINKPKILLVNKTDRIAKEKIASIINMFSKIMDFDEVVPISAKTGYNVDTYVNIINSLLKTGPMFFGKDEITNQTIRQMVAEIIREKSLHKLEKEIPHGIVVLISIFKYINEKDIYDISAEIICEKDSHKKIIIGKKGDMIKQIGINSRYEIEQLLEKKVNLNLFVKIKKAWRNNEFYVSNYGYKKEEI